MIISLRELVLIMNGEIKRDIDLNKVKACIVECLKAVGKDKETPKPSKFNHCSNDYSRSW